MTERLAALLYRKRHRAFAACFLTPEGELTEPGAIVMHTLKTICDDPSPRNLTGNDGKIDSHAVMLALGAANVYRVIMKYLHFDERTLQRQIDSANLSPQQNESEL